MVWNVPVPGESGTIDWRPERSVAFVVAPKMWLLMVFRIELRRFFNFPFSRLNLAESPRLTASSNEVIEKVPAYCFQFASHSSNTSTTVVSNGWVGLIDSTVELTWYSIEP